VRTKPPESDFLFNPLLYRKNHKDVYGILIWLQDDCFLPEKKIWSGLLFPNLNESEVELNSEDEVTLENSH
jgi:hypothetical protein